jgi:biotin carboxyl carrier protein
MGHAYTPGLKVSAAAGGAAHAPAANRRRGAGAVGERVQPDTVVARALLPGNVVTLHLSRQLGVAPADLHELLLVKEGGAVSKGQPVARSKGLFGS